MTAQTQQTVGAIMKKSSVPTNFFAMRHTLSERNFRGLKECHHQFFMTERHPEQQDDEVFISNVSNRTLRIYRTMYPEIGCLRLGKKPNVYSMNDNHQPKRGVRPLFVKKDVYQRVLASLGAA